jgi:putative two-component system response regulator
MREQILIVDDEEMVRDVERQMLSRAGFACRSAASVQEAITILREGGIALTLIDINMPGHSGEHLLRQLPALAPETAAIMVTGVDDLETALGCLRQGAEDYLVKPLAFDRLVHTVGNILEKRRLQQENRSYQLRLEEKVREQTLQIRAAFDELQQTYDHTLQALARSLDAREREGGAHSERVHAYTLHLAARLGTPPAPMAAIGKAALLHDLGKVGIADSILLKPGPLTEEEWVEMKKHAQIGHDIIAGVPFLRETAEIILAHHERYDGTGYPRRLQGTRIPLGARIFTLADTLDAMTSDRPYRRALPFAKVIEELTRCRGSQFDPEIVDAFLAIPRAEWEELAGRRFA